MSGALPQAESQDYRLVTATPERIPARTFAALWDILDCGLFRLSGPVWWLTASGETRRGHQLNLAPSRTSRAP